MLPVSLKKRWASRLWTAGAVLCSSGVFAQEPRCAADLARVQKEFCINEQHQNEPAVLNYEWQLTGDSFDLKAKVCFSGASEPEIVLAIDRSESLRNADRPQKKLGSDGISIANQLIEEWRQQISGRASNGKKVGIVMFSGDAECREYQSGPIGVNGDFPCVYIPARSISDPAHSDHLIAFLNAADGKYALGDRPSAGKYEIIAQLIGQQRLNLSNEGHIGVILFSDGRSYQSSLPYPYLRSQAFLEGQRKAKEEFANPAMKRVNLIFARIPSPTLVYDNINFGVSYENMCDPSVIPPAAEVDCKSPVSIENPITWPSNQIDTQGYAQQLGMMLGGFDVVKLSAKADLDSSIARLNALKSENIRVDSARVSINQGEDRSVPIDGDNLLLGTYLANQENSLDIKLQVNGNQLNVPISIKATKVLNATEREFENQEMYCTANSKDTLQGELYKMQGGAASCGEIGSRQHNKRPPLSRLGVYLVLFVPVFVALIISSGFGVGRFLIFFLLLPTLFSDKAFADTLKKDGVNMLNYRPVLGAVAQTESAETVEFGKINAGLFVDYSNDVVELVDRKNKRIRSVLDNVVAAHVLVNAGLMSRVSLGLHLPYVHKADLSRELDGEAVHAGQIGMPSDGSVLLKLNFYKRESIKFSLMPIATVPLGRTDLLVSDGVAKYGSLAILSGGSSEFKWAINTGYLQRERPKKFVDQRAYSVILRGHGLIGVGSEYKLDRDLAVGTSLQLKPSAGEGLKAGQASPAEWMLVAKIKSFLDLETSGGFGTGIGPGIGSPDYRIWAGLSWLPNQLASQSSSKNKAIPGKKSRD